MKQEKTTIEQLQWLYRVNRGNNWRVGFLSLLKLLQSILTVGNILIMKQAIDGASSQDEALFIQSVWLYIGLVLVQLVLQAGVRYFEEDSSARMANNLRRYSFTHMLHGKLQDVNEYHSGALMGRLMGDSRVVSNYILSIVPGAVGSASRLALCFVVLVQLNAMMSVAAVCGGLLFFLASVLLRDTLKKASRDIQEAEDGLRKFLKESIDTIPMIRSFSVEPQMEATADKILENHRLKRMHRAIISMVCNTGFGAVFRFVYILCFIWCGFEIVNNRISFGTLTAALQLVSQVQTPIADLSGYIPKFFSLLVSTERVREVTDLPQESDAPPVQLGDFQQIHCESVSFGYDGEKILRYRPLTIRRGDCIAIKDQSGAGKSTFFKLLLQFYQPQPSSHMEVTFQDGTSMPLSKETRPLFAYVPQDNLVLSGTIAENVGSVDGDSPDLERVRQACTIACAHRFIEALPHQYHQVIGEKGLGLSEGQVQRLAIARAVYANRPILLLDEATSALDEQTEHQILMNLKNETDHTILLISHRKTSVSLCDTAVEIMER